VEIRRLIASDAAKFWRLRLEALEREPASFAQAAEELRQVTPEVFGEHLGDAGNDNFVLGALHDAKLQGVTGFHREPRLKRRHKGMIWGVYVSPDHRGQGVARALLSGVIEIVRTIPDLRLLTLSVNAQREPARRLYRSLGFEAWGVEPQALRVDDTYFDEEHMVLKLEKTY
jgi:RimJ/RimL family protein N-acetyltransferase